MQRILTNRTHKKINGKIFYIHNLEVNKIYKIYANVNIWQEAMDTYFNFMRNNSIPYQGYRIVSKHKYKKQFKSIKK